MTSRGAQPATGAVAALATAVLAGLLRWPHEIARHAEAIARLAGFDDRFDAVLDIADSGTVLESATLATIFANKGLALPMPDSTRRSYPFLKDAVDPGLATETLAAAIVLLVEEPDIDAAIEDATVRFDMEEQARLRAKKDGLRQRLKELTARQNV